MNSLYKMYLKRGAVLLFIGALITLAIMYMSYVRFIVYNLGADEGSLVSAVDNFAEVYTARCFFINIILFVVLLYGFYSGRNRHTGVFVMSLPIKSSRDFTAKLAVLLCFIALMFAFDILLFNAVMKLKEREYISAWEYLYNVCNVQMKTLQDINSNFYEYMSGFISLSLVFSTAVMFFSENMGVTGFSVIMPVTALMLFSGFFQGLSSFLTAAAPGVFQFVEKICRVLLNIGVRYGNMKYTVSIFDRYIPFYTVYIVFGSFLSLILILLAFASSKLSDHSCTGSLFLSPCFRRLAYIIGTVTGGFSFWLFIDIVPGFERFSNTLAWNYIMLVLCFAFSYYIISRLEKLFS